MLNVTEGFWSEEVEGVPPSNVQFQLLIVPLKDSSVKSKVSPWQIVNRVVEKSALHKGGLEIAPTLFKLEVDQ